MAALVFYSFVLNFVVYPGVCLATHLDMLSGLGGKEKAWFGLTMVAVFNACNTVGPIVAGRYPLYPPRLAWIPAFLRSVFVPTFLLIALAQPPQWLFCSDWFRLVNMALFALTNGHVVTVCMCSGPDRVTKEDRELAGFIMGFSLSAGIFVGALIATFGLERINFAG